MLCVVGLKVLMCSSHWRRRLRPLLAPFFEPVMLSTSRIEQINSTTGAGTPVHEEKKVNSVPSYQVTILQMKDLSAHWVAIFCKSYFDTRRCKA